MKEVKRSSFGSNCNCSKPQMLLEFNFSLSKDHIAYFTANNFSDTKSYTKVGILYIEDTNLIAIGPFGSNRLQIKCKNSNCNGSLAILENLIINIP